MRKKYFLKKLSNLFSKGPWFLLRVQGSRVDHFLFGPGWELMSDGLSVPPFHIP